MSDDLKKITAKEWRAQASLQRGYKHSCCVTSEQIAWNAATEAAADYCARMAEEAEGREACARGEHRPRHGELLTGHPGVFCSRCHETLPTDEPSAEDVRFVISHLSGCGANEWTRIWPVIVCLIRDYAKRKGIAL